MRAPAASVSSSGWAARTTQRRGRSSGGSAGRWAATRQRACQASPAGGGGATARAGEAAGAGASTGIAPGHAAAEVGEGFDLARRAGVVRAQPLVLGGEVGEPPGGELGGAVLAQQAHVEVAVVGGALGLAVAGGGRPGARQVEEAVPVDARGAPREELGGLLEAELLHLLGAEGRHP